MKTKKRGFAALVITILAFSLLMAIGVTAVTKFLIFGFEEGSSCEEVKIKLDKIKSGSKESDICQKSSFTKSDVRFNVINIGKTQIRGVIVNMKGAKGTEKEELILNIKRGFGSEQTLSYNLLKNENLEEVTVIPVFGRQRTRCFESLITTSDIGTC